MGGDKKAERERPARAWSVAVARPRVRKRGAAFVTFFGSVTVQVEKLRGAFQQIGRRFSRLVVHPTRRVRERNLFPGACQFHGTHAIQHLRDFAHVALWQHQHEIVVGQPHRIVRPAARFFQPPGKLLQRLIHRCLSILLGQVRQVFPGGWWLGSARCFVSLRAQFLCRGAAVRRSACTGRSLDPPWQNRLEPPRYPRIRRLGAVPCLRNLRNIPCRYTIQALKRRSRHNIPQRACSGVIS